MAWVNVIDLFWPVGSIYYSIYNDNNDPATLFGGTWVEITGANNAIIQIGTTQVRAWQRTS